MDFARETKGGGDEGRASLARPLLRGVVTLSKPVKSARLYASAHGVYQLWLNGEKVGDQFLAPGWTDYTRRLQSQTYDVTAHLHAGDNVIGAALGDVWYRGKVGLGRPLSGALPLKTTV